MEKSKCYYLLTTSLYETKVDFDSTLNKEPAQHLVYFVLPSQCCFNQQLGDKLTNHSGGTTCPVQIFLHDMGSHDYTMVYVVDILQD